MAQMTRWDPFRDMVGWANAMDRLFADRAFRPVRWTEEVSLWVPLDVYEDGDKYVVEAVLPGLKPEDVNVSVQGNTLTVSGELTQEANRNYLLRERSNGKFARTLALPVEVDADKVEATFADGVLHLSLPKAPAYQARKIAIKAGS